MDIEQLLLSADIAVPREIRKNVLSQPVFNVVCHSQEVTANSIFVAIRGFVEDGHEYIQDASRRGACLAVVEQLVDCPLPQIPVANSRLALAHLAAAFHNFPGSKLKLIGITGTNGKTTITNMIYHILSLARPSGLIGSVHVKIGKTVHRSHVTTPEPVELQQTLADMVEANLEWVTMEVSSHGLKLHRVDGLEFQVAGISNLTSDHLDLHQSLSDYIDAKQRLFTMLDPVTGIALYNGDDPLSKEVASVSKVPLLSFGQNSQCDLSFRITGSNGFFLTFSPRAKQLIPTPLEDIQLNLSIFGRHNLYNSVLAIAAALLARCPLEQVIEGITSFPGVRRRLQVLYDREFKVLDDYGHNPDGLKAAIRAARSLNPRRLLVVFAVRGNRGVEINRDNGITLKSELGETGIPVLLWVSHSRDVVTDKDLVSSEEHKAFSTALAGAAFPIHEEPLLDRALRDSLHAAREGDIVLLLGAQGMDAAQTLIASHLPVSV